MKYVIIMLFVLGISVATIPAYGELLERGKDYQKKLLGYTEDGLAEIEWTSSPDRLYSDGNWINYKITEDDTNIKVETANAAINFNKQTCTIRLYDEGIIKSKETPIVNSISSTLKEAPADSDQWILNGLNSVECQTSITTDDTTVHIKAIRAQMLGPSFEAIYDIDYGGLIKVTYRYYNGDITKVNTRFGFVQSFDGAFQVKIGDQTYNTSQIVDEVFFDKAYLQDKAISISKNGITITYDPQDYIHDRLWGLKISNNHMNLDFTNADDITPIGQTLELDPVYGYTLGTRLTPSSLIGACNTVDTSVYATAGYQGGDGNYCYRLTAYFNIATIPTTVGVTDVKLNYTIANAAGSPYTCNYMSMKGNPSTQSITDNWNDIINGTTFVSGDSGCTTNGSFKILDLGTSADSDLESGRRTDTEWAVGIAPSTRTTAFNWSQFTAAYLRVVYLSTPPPQPSTLSATSEARQADFTWTMPYGGNVTKFYLGRSLDNSTWPSINKTLVNSNVTTYHSYGYWRINQLYYVNITASNGLNSTSARFSSFTTDSLPSAPVNPYTTPLSDTVIKLNWSPATSSGGDTISGYRIDYCITCTAWTTLVNNTNTLNYNHTGITGLPTVKYRMATWNGVGLSSFTANFTGTTFQPTTGTVTLTSGVVGDTIQINSTISITQASPSPVTVSQLKLYRNGSLVETKATSVQIASGASSSNFDPFWNRMLTGNNYSFKLYATVSNSTGTVALASSNLTSSREYDPSYFNALTEPAVEGQVNYTLSRFDDEDGIHLQVNRQGGALGGTWEINCITQTNTEAAATRNQSLNWPGTWVNYSNVGYFNGTWDGFVNTHGYVTCFNPPGILFTATSYTNSSLALFGIEIFDNSYGAMLGVPVGIFFLAMAGSMANKRTAPTWIIVVLAMAGTMAAIGFFTLNPLIWGLALVTGLLGVLVNQKVF